MRGLRLQKVIREEEDLSSRRICVSKNIAHAPSLDESDWRINNRGVSVYMSTSLKVVPSQITSNSVSYVVPCNATACVKLPTAPLLYFHMAEVYRGMREPGSTLVSSSKPILVSRPGSSTCSTVCVRTEDRRAGPPKRRESDARWVACSTMAVRSRKCQLLRLAGEKDCCRMRLTTARDLLVPPCRLASILVGHVVLCTSSKERQFRRFSEGKEKTRMLTLAAVPMTFKPLASIISWIAWTPLSAHIM